MSDNLGVVHFDSDIRKERAPRSSKLLDDYNKNSGIVDKVLELWKSITKRPYDAPAISDEDKKILEESLEEYSQLEYFEIFSFIKSAAIMRPVANDHADFKRLINVFSDDEYRDLAHKESLRVSSYIHIYTGEDPLAERKESILLDFGLAPEDTVNIGEYENFYLCQISEMDQEKYDYILGMITEAYGDDTILPSDFIMFPQNARDAIRTNIIPDPYVAKEPKEQSDDSLGVGGQEGVESPKSNIEELLYSEEMIVDIGATKMMNQGVPPDDVLGYHNQAPDGYWKAVIQELENNDDAGVTDVYQKLEESFYWHPRQRQKPFTL